MSRPVSLRYTRTMMSRLLPLLVAMATACTSEPGPGLVDGGGFRFPDSGPIDTGTYVPDSGVPDSGPFACPLSCAGGQVCGCIDDDCGCHRPRANNETCDPQVPASCAGGLPCVRARRDGVDVTICSDGSDGTSCSHTADVCTTAFGCVCLTMPSGSTDCRCTEYISPDPAFCDPMVPGTCPNGACVRTESAVGAIYFVCSDGSEGQPCEGRTDTHCQTSLGCTCPLVRDHVDCRCSEPSGEGGPCDPDVAGSCIGTLDCRLVGDMFNGRSTVCGSDTPGGPDGGMRLECNPNNPTTCQPPKMCILTAEGYVCQ